MQPNNKYGTPLVSNFSSVAVATLTFLLGEEEGVAILVLEESVDMFVKQ